MPSPTHASVSLPAPAPPSRLERYREPRASPIVMRITRWLIRHLAFPGVAVLGRLPGFCDRFPWFRGLRITAVDLPPGDEARLRDAVRPDTAAFLAPNHPEYFTDLLVDWEVGSRLSWKMAFVAGYHVVNDPLLGHVWRRHNMIANVPGGPGREHTLKCALQGDGVLLHPEGNVAWTSDVVQPIFPGIATLPLEAARRARRRDGRPVVIQPLVYRYRFVEDATPGLMREMDRIEERLSLPRHPEVPLCRRFVELHKALLCRDEAEWSAGPSTAISDDALFARQAAFLHALLAQLEGRFGQPAEAASLPERIRQVQRAGRGLPKGSDDARTLERGVAACRRALHFSAESYGGAVLYPEQIAESLKRVRHDLFDGRRFDGLRRMMPFPVADRVIHVRAAAPIDVGPLVEAADQDEQAVVDALLLEVRARMQGALDALGEELQPQRARFARPNPLHRGGQRGSGPPPASRVDARAA